jgi:hypothetical protein
MKIKIKKKIFNKMPHLKLKQNKNSTKKKSPENKNNNSLLNKERPE